MISELQQEQASLYVLGALTAAERESFETELREVRELRELVFELQRTTALLARACPPSRPSPDLKSRILQQIETGARRSETLAASSLAMIPGFRFIEANDPSGWKQLPVPGASVKLLSVDRERGYAVLLGRLAPRTRYPAHTHAGSEELFLLSGDLRIGGQVMRPGDFHHSDAGTSHEDNYSEEGCTLLAILSVDHALAKFALA